MAKGTQIVIKSPERTDFGLPKRLGLYFVGEARSIGPGSHFNVCVDVLRENDLFLPRPPVFLQARCSDTARELVIRYYSELAERLKLDISITEISETGERQTRSTLPPRRASAAALP